MQDGENNASQTNSSQPGMTFRPGQPPIINPPNQQHENQPQAENAPQAENPPSPEVEQTPPQTPSAFQQSDYETPPSNVQQPQQPDDDQNTVTWTASEFAASQKSSTWFIQFGFIAAVIIIIVYIITRDEITAATLAVVAILFAVMAGRQPKTQTYSVAETGINVGDKFYPYSDFKSFSVIHEGGVSSISFLPVRRFATGLSMYYEPDQEDEIVSAVGQHVPHEDRQQDAVDRLMSRIKF